MSSNDFVIRIILDAQSKIAPVMATAAAEAKKLEDRFVKTDLAAKGLDDRMEKLTNHVEKARGTMQLMNPTLEALGRHSATLSTNIVGVNRNMGVLERNSAKAGAALGSLGGIVKSLEVKLAKLDAKMTEMGAKTYSPKVEVDGMAESEARIDALTMRLIGLEQKRRTVKIGIEREILDREINEVEASLDKLGDPGAERYVKVKVQLDDYDVKRRTADNKKYAEEFVKDTRKALDTDNALRVAADQEDIDRQAEQEARRHAASEKEKLDRIQAGVEAKKALVAAQDARKRADEQDSKDQARKAEQDIKNAKMSIKAIEDEHRRSVARQANIAAGNIVNDARSPRDVSYDKGTLAQARQQINALGGPQIKVGVELSEIDRVKLEEYLTRLGVRREHVKVLIDADRSQGELAGLRAANFFKTAFNKVTKEGGGLGADAEHLFTSSGLRTAAIRTAALFSEPLLSALTAVGGALISVGSSAGVAAVGLAGLASAASAQAIPVLGVLGLAISRIAAVTKVAQLAQAERDKGTQQGLAADSARANAQDALEAAHQGVKNALDNVAQAELGVADAQRAVVDAQRGVIDAQEQLNQARRDGLRTLEDMNLAERQAFLTAQQSQLGLAMRTAMGGGGLVQSAQLQAESDTRDSARQTADNTAAQAGGIEGLPAVKSARDAVTQANKGVDQAVRGVANAKRAVVQAGQGVDNARKQVERAQRGMEVAAGKMGAAATAYSIALGKLSEGDKALLRSIENFKTLFAKGSEIRGISDLIVVSFAGALDKVAALFQDSEVLASFRSLATNIATAIDDLATFLTTGPMRDALKFFSDEAAKNVGNVGRIFQNLLTIFTNVARAASGAFGIALKGTVGSLDALAKKTSSKEWQEGASKFFVNALEPIKAFLHLGGAIIGLFAAIAGPGGGAEEGTSGIERLTTTIRNATKWVQAHGEEVQAFLHDTMNATSDVLRVVVAIAAALVKTFDSDSVKGFADFLITTVLPVLASFVAFLGTINRAIFAVFNNDAVSTVVKFLAPFLLGLKIFAAVTSAFGRMIDRTILWAATSRTALIATEVLKTAFGLLRGAMMLLVNGNPFAWAVVAGIALYELYKHVKVFHDAVDAVVKFFREHWKLLLPALLGPIGLMIVALTQFGPKILKILSGAFSSVTSWLSGVGSKIFDPLKPAFNKIKGWADSTFGYVKDKLNAIGGFLGFGGDNKLDKAIKEAERKAAEMRRQRDAQNSRDAAELDNLPKDFRVNSDAVYRRGGPQQTPAATSKPSDNSKKRDKQFDYFDTVDAKVSPEEAKQIKTLWQDIVSSTDGSTKKISKLVRDMRVAIEATLNHLKVEANHDFTDIWDSGRQNFASLDKSIAHSMGNIKTTVIDTMDDIAKAFYNGFSYIVSTTNESLKAFDAKPAKITIAAPRPEGHADGGWIGQMGERGQDAVHTILGKGEAVLNATQQKVVEPALNAMYGFGLGDMFKRTRGYHAGGAEQQGFAAGGLTGPYGSGAAFTPLANFAKSKFGLSMTAGRTNHGFNTASGNVSDHSWGGAGDFSNGVLTPQEDAFNAFIKTKLPQVVKQLIWRNVDQFQGFPVSGHEDHVHLAVKRDLAFDGPRMAKILSGAAKGLDISSLLAGIGGDGSSPQVIDHVKAPDVKGQDGNVKNMAVGVLRRLTRAANAFIDKQAGVDRGNISAGPNDLTSTYDGPLDRVFPRHIGPKAGAVRLSPTQVASVAEGAGLPGNQFSQIAHGESDYYPGIQQPDPGDGMVGYGLWQMTPNAWGSGSKLHKILAGLGGIPALFNPVVNSKMAKVLYSEAGNSFAPWYGTKYLTRASGGFADFAAKSGMQWGGMQANGGDYVVDKPTMFVAGDNGAERATFKPLRAATGKAPERSDFAPLGSIAGGDLPKLTTQLFSSPKKMADRAGGIVDLLDEFTRKQLRSLKAALTGAVKGTKDDSKIRKDLADLQDALKKYLTDPLTILTAGIKRFEGFANVGGVRKILDDVGDAVDNIGIQIRMLSKNHTKKSADKLSESLTKMGKALDFIAGEEGPLALLEQQLTNRTAVAARRLVKRQFTVNSKNQARRLPISDNTIAGQEIADLYQTRSGLTGENKEVNRLMGQARAGLKRATTNEQRQLFRGTIANLTTRRESIANSRAANAQTIVERRETQQQSGVDKASTGFDLRRTSVELGRRFLAAGGRAPDASTYDTQTTIATDQIGDLSKRLKSAKSTGNAKLAASIEAQIAELNISIMELASAKMTALIDAVNTAGDKRVAGIERGSRIGEILGTGSRAGKDAKLAASYTTQIEDLKKIDTTNNPALTEQVAVKIEELKNSIAEVTADSLQAGIDEVNKAGDRRDAKIGLHNRLADLITRGGDALGGMRARGAAAAEQLSSNQERRLGLQAQLVTAMKEGNMGAVETLTASLDDLDVTIKENEQAIIDNTHEVRKLSLDIISQRTSRTTGLLGSVQTIQNSVAALSGSSTVAATLAVLTAVGEALTAAAQAITTEVQSAISKNEFAPAGASILMQLVAAFTQGPEAFAAALLRLAPLIAAFESTLTGPALVAFQALIDGMVSNTTATAENTAAMSALNGTVAQTFSSPGWLSFRAGIFDGNGGLLPAPATPQGVIREASGPSGISTPVLPPSMLIMSGGGNDGSSIGDVNVHITNPTETADPVYIGERIAWKLTSTGRQ